MSFTVAKNLPFDIRATLECGQVFRYFEKDGVFTVFSADKKCQIIERENDFELILEDEIYFKNYFDFDTNYDIIQRKVQDKDLISSAIGFGRGIRILKQDPFEVIVSFIISANNNIARIKSIIERICKALGRDMGGYHAFPEPAKLAEQDAEFFFKAGAGYRAKYLAEAAKRLFRLDINALKALDTPRLRKTLMELPGVGRKVADCALLFGFSRTEVFPVDTWIKKVFSPTYGNIPADKLSCVLSQKFGEYSGYVQQWLFYKKRCESLKANRRQA
jgi:N-glycosylase/DNA lyase